jgi:hypothetical protein
MCRLMSFCTKTGGVRIMSTHFLSTIGRLLGSPIARPGYCEMSSQSFGRSNKGVLGTSVRRLLAVAAIPIIGGCPSSEPLKIDEIDYGAKQAKAAILVSDPQVFARASLINDRRHETEYLQQLLINSQVDSNGNSVVKFAPQILRDLKTVETLSASLGLSFGKGNRTSATDLNDQIQVAKLQAQLAVLQKQIEGIEAAKPPDVTIPAPSPSSDLSTSANGTDAHVITPDVSKLQAAVSSIQTQLASLASSAVGGPTAPSSSYATLFDPRDDLLDRQAYRRDIRAALAEAQLDDTHNRGGNALYRLQFEATVLPPDGKNKQWAAAKLRIEPPVLNGEEIVADYYNWLSRISSLLSEAPSKSGHNYDYDRYVAQIGVPEYFQIMDVLVSVDYPIKWYCMNHTLGTDDQLRELSKLDDTGHHRQVVGTDAHQYRLLGVYAAPPHILDGGHACASFDDIQGKAYPTQAENSIPSDSARLITRAIPRYEFPKENTFSLPIGKLNSSGESKSLNDDLHREKYVPKEFCEKIALPRSSDDVPKLNGKCDPLSLPGLFLAAGGTSGDETHDYSIRSYSVMPVVLAQRLGVTTEASQSLQTALTVAAQLSAAASAGANLGYLSQSDARTEALSRQPIVVGFSGADGYDPNYDPNKTPTYDRVTRAEEIGEAPGGSYFGWLFGPQFAVKDSKTLSLQQTVRTYGVTADVSIPGWWNYVDLIVSTAWINNWKSADLLPDPKDANARFMKKRVDLPEEATAYDALTEFIAKAGFKVQNSRIFASSVVPDVVPTCASSVTFQINGTNIWRASSALLGGVPAKLITVLPDMNGITAQFDMEEVYGSRVNADSAVQVVPLLVSAEEGSAVPLTVYLVGRRQNNNGAVTCQSPLLAPARLETLKPTPVSYAPTSICTDTGFFRLIVQGLNLEKGLKVASGVFHSPPNNKGSTGDEHTQVLTLQRDWSALQLTARTIPLVLEKGESGTAFYTNLELKECKATDTSSKP